MSYRSSIYIYLEEAEYLKSKGKTLEQVIEKAQKEEEFDEECFEIKKNKKGNRVLRFHETYLKWYSEFPIVKYWNEIAREMTEDFNDEILMVEEGEDGKLECFGEYGEAYQTLAFDVDFGDDKDETK